MRSLFRVLTLAATNASIRSQISTLTSKRITWRSSRDLSSAYKTSFSSSSRILESLSRRVPRSTRPLLSSVAASQPRLVFRRLTCHETRMTSSSSATKRLLKRTMENCSRYTRRKAQAEALPLLSCETQSCMEATILLSSIRCCRGPYSKEVGRAKPTATS